MNKALKALGVLTTLPSASETRSCLCDKSAADQHDEHNECRQHAKRFQKEVLILLYFCEQTELRIATKHIFAYTWYVYHFVQFVAKRFQSFIHFTFTFLTNWTK
jgi:hypothetical protein